MKSAACVCGEINTRHCPVHGQGESAAQGRFLPSFRTWPHRDGGRVMQLYGDTWKLEVSWAHRRRDRYGVRTPFTATLHRYEVTT